MYTVSYKSLSFDTNKSELRHSVLYIKLYLLPNESFGIIVI